MICSVSEASAKDVDTAVVAARKAFNGEWRQTTPQGRGNLLMKLADICETNKELLAAVESLDNGKSISMARGDVGAVVGCLRYYAGWSDKIEGKTLDINPNQLNYTRQEPVSRHQDQSGRRELQANNNNNSSASAARSSPGTSPSSCSRGRSAPRSAPATPSS